MRQYKDVFPPPRILIRIILQQCLDIWNFTLLNMQMIYFFVNAKHMSVFVYLPLCSECTTELGSTPNFRINIAKYKVLEKAISENSDQNEDEVCRYLTE